MGRGRGVPCRAAPDRQTPPHGASALRQLGLELTTAEVEVIDERDERVAPMYNRPEQLYQELPVAYAAGESHSTSEAESDSDGEA